MTKIENFISEAIAEQVKEGKGYFYVDFEDNDNTFSVNGSYKLELEEYNFDYNTGCSDYIIMYLAVSIEEAYAYDAEGEDVPFDLDWDAVETAACKLIEE